jgi:ESS family glutamate:Na+ symporter
MTTLVLDARQTLIAAILVLYLGKWLTRHVAFLRRYNIPEPVTGGGLASLAFGALHLYGHTTVGFDLGGRDTFLIVFFTCVGLSARVSTLLQGGRALLTLLALAVVMLALQNLTGVAVARLTGLAPAIGILGGSVSLSGGHGTAIAWSHTFIEAHGLPNAMEIGMACATFGLVLGGVVGGPLANLLVKRHALVASSEAPITVGQRHAQPSAPLTVDSVLNGTLVIAVAIGIGTQLHAGLAALGLPLPAFVSCLFAGILLTNTVPLLFRHVTWPTGTPFLALASDLTLGLFLAMSLMSLQLWTLLDLAGPIVLLLAAQVALVVAFAGVVLFRALGANYDAAVIAAGYAGLALGATPTAIANMAAVTARHGASPKALLVVPLVGAFFIDIANALVIETMLRHLG